MCGVWETQDCVAGGGGSGGVWSRNLISSLDIINSGSKGCKPDPLKAPWIFFLYGDIVGGMKGDKKLGLRDVRNMRLEFLDFFAVRLFERPKTTNVKWLE